MVLRRLEVSGVRNLEAVSLDLTRLNLFWGANGSGKSSLLEAVHIIGLGRSFRSIHPRHYIRHGDSQCTVFAQLDNDHALGIAKLGDGSHVLKRNGATMAHMAEFAHDLPIQLIHPDGMDLLDGGSKPRRQLLDWLVFHVEHRFYRVWLRYQKALDQRNALLKQYQASAPEFEVWEREMALAAVELDQYREAVLRKWKEDLLILLPELLPEIDLRMEYHKGFSTDTDFIEQLRESRHRDRERGHTQIGPHRADLRLKTDGGAVDAVLSRGQKKLLICALKLAQVAVLKAGNRRCVVLLDDLASELDGLARERLLVSLQALQAQVLMTALDPEQLWPVLQRLDRRARLFHVEQGKIVPDTAVAVTEETP